MHIPDGFLSPQTYLPAYGLAAGAWAWAARDLRRQLDETTVPRLAMLTALAYGLGLVMVPLPGGTSGHAMGVAIIALVFGLRPAFLAYSLVLGLQALLLGAGGITALPVNALAMGLCGAATAIAVRRMLARLGETLSVALAAWFSLVLPGALVAGVLGLQPLVAQDEAGMPLFFPFGFGIVLPAILLPQALVGLGEAALTVALWRYARRRNWIATA